MRPYRTGYARFRAKVGTNHRLPTAPAIFAPDNGTYTLVF
ncbi:hypothetical protein CLV84_3692 [Neolewinella xylanilytica]|uniref:Uncharacterized protein n=1 Tax=Neolewinella xylanilytica TaxID=1514080 RepID=A0A2S6I0P4_9BACT|nr:hypothetical protein CLV84_3692 [Neolewinella xylanilytica]